MWFQFWRAGNIVFLALASFSDWPYSIYMLLRVTTSILFATLAYFVFKMGKQPWGVLFAALLILYNPLLRVHLDRQIWGIINIATAVVLLISFWVVKKPIKDDGKI